MKRPTLIPLVLFVIAAMLPATLLLVRNGPPQPAAAAVLPTPTPTPVGIAYDEITRMAFGNATPPPPGSFQPDYRRIIADIPPANQPAPAAHGLAGMFGRMMGGQNLAQMTSGLNMMRDGTLKRYTFYWVRGWIRIDDPAAHTAQIEKCSEHQTILLDLARKTYRIVEMTEGGSAPPPPPAPRYGPAPPPAGPGTGVMTVSNKVQALGPKTLEGIHTRGFATTASMEMSKATGTCSNGAYGAATVEYISGIHKPRAYCPLPRTRAMGMGGMPGARGGCKPRLVVRSSGPTKPSGYLAMYRRTSFKAGNGAGAHGTGGAFVMERGNVDWFYNPDVPALFSIPAGFKQIR